MMNFKGFLVGYHVFFDSILAGINLRSNKIKINLSQLLVNLAYSTVLNVLISMFLSFYITSLSNSNYTNFFDYSWKILTVLSVLNTLVLLNNFNETFNLPKIIFNTISHFLNAKLWMYLVYIISLYTFSITIISWVIIDSINFDSVSEYSDTLKITTILLASFIVTATVSKTVKGNEKRSLIEFIINGYLFFILVLFSLFQINKLMESLNEVNAFIIVTLLISLIITFNSLLDKGHSYIGASSVKDRLSIYHDKYFTYGDFKELLIYLVGYFRDWLTLTLSSLPIKHLKKHPFHITLLLLAFIYIYQLTFKALKFMNEKKNHSFEGTIALINRIDWIETLVIKIFFTLLVFYLIYLLYNRYKFIIRNRPGIVSVMDFCASFLFIFPFIIVISCLVINITIYDYIIIVDIIRFSFFSAFFLLVLGYIIKKITGGRSEGSSSDS